MITLVRNLLNKFLSRIRYIDFATKVVEKQPAQQNIPEKTVVVVSSYGIHKWALIKCPCGCNEILTLSLMKSQKPNWEVNFDRLNRVSLSPSVWKSDGCKSHFFVHVGKLVWAK